MTFALTGARIFDGEDFYDGHAVLIDGRYVTCLVPEAQIPPSTNVQKLKGGLLAPGFIDVQVNGGGGALLNASPDVATVCTIAKCHRRFGTTGLLPTVITDAPQVMHAAVAAVSAAMKMESAVLGIHIEGPFIDEARKGAHEARYIRALTADDVAWLSQLQCGVVMLTVAPNKVTPTDIKQLTKAGLRLSLGHAEAIFAEVEAALAAGAQCFTHLYNAMSPLTAREPGMVGAALLSPEAYVGLIADGHHVSDGALRLAFAAKASDKFLLVSDAMPSAAGGPDHFLLQDRLVKLKDGRLQLADGTLAGSNLTMDGALRHCVNTLDVPLGKALQMAARNPARFLGLDKSLGHIAAGVLASIVHLDDNLHVKATWVEGT
jgi:N-acetylglucosamine-6-phosphate deacetylase